MKIAIPVNEKSMEDGVCQSFGRTQYFLIYDLESKEEIFIDNSAAASQGGAGIKAAQTIVDSGAKALITFRCGENAAQVINAAEIKMYKAIGDSIQENIDNLIDGKLHLLEEIHEGFHNHGK